MQPKNSEFGLFHILKKMKRSFVYQKAKAKAHIRNPKLLALIPTLSPLVSKNSPQYIVSLTSYKGRLTGTAPYAIISILNQNVKPDKVVLWVGHQDKENVPEIIHDLTQKGLEICFCDDVKAYTKLVYSLEAYPADYIITADDDIYYPENWLEQILDEHKKNPQKIICNRAHAIRVDENHSLLPYNKWDSFINPHEVVHRPQSVFPEGVGGILYPPNALHKDVTNKELFMKLSPHNDDIWYWAMAVMNKENFSDGSPYAVVENGYAEVQSIDPDYETGEYGLWQYNILQNENDEQFKAVIAYYPKIKENLQKIEPNSENYWRKLRIALKYNW
jgi:hypothetical protein